MINKWINNWLRGKFKNYEKAAEVKPPFWFNLLLGIFLRMSWKNVVDKYPTGNVGSIRGIKRFLILRCYTQDWTFPLPKKMYARRYRSRLPNSMLFELYSTVKTILEMSSNEQEILRQLLDSPILSVAARKFLRGIQIKREETAETFWNCLVDEGEVFGKYEAGILNNLSGGTEMLKALTVILGSLEDAIRLDAIMKSVRSNLRSNILMAVATNVLVLVYIVPLMLEGVGVTNMPPDVEIIYNIGKWMQSPFNLGILGVIILGFYMGWKYINGTPLRGYITLRMPKISKVFIFGECMKFMSNFFFQVRYIIDNDLTKLRSSANVVSNGFMLQFFHKKIDEIEAAGSNTDAFFDKNNFFPEVVRYKMGLGSIGASLVDKVEEIYGWYRQQNKELENEIPDLISSLSLYIMTIATGISGLITARVEMIFMMGDVFK